MADSPGTRINRFIASCGVCSRRKADDLIVSGRVKVNGETVINPGRIITLDDRLEIDGIPVAVPSDKIYLLFNKPLYCLCTMRDPQGRKIVLDYLPENLKKLRPFPAGRLDYMSEGLLILTNDGDFAQKLIHPSNDKKKIYNVTIKGNASPFKIGAMESGMTLPDGTRLRPVKCRASRLENGNTLLNIELKQGVNRQIRRMCKMLNLEILKLERIAIEFLTLDGVPPGKYRALTPQEVEKLTKKGG